MGRDNRIEADEDRMIQILYKHKEFVTCTVEVLKKEGIDAKRTVGNNPNGDVEYQGDKESVQEALDKHFGAYKVTKKE